MSEMRKINELNEDEKRLYALEALLKRISLIPMPFVLKGSLLTRQYLNDRDVRDAQDIDFLYAGEVYDGEEAYEKFTDWLIQATEMNLNDGVVFESFRNAPDWEEFSYGMADDFPTTNAEIAYQFKDETGKLSRYYYLDLDVSFNFEMTIQPIPLEYTSEFFGNFHLPHTTPLSIQVAWKLHQMIVRPRFKDLYDLKYLLSHPAYDNQALQETLQEIVTECSFDRYITNSDIKRVLVSDLYELYPSLRWDSDLLKYANKSEPETYFKEFATELRKIMDSVGINQTAFDNLPKPK